MLGPVRLVVCANQRLASAQRSCVGSGSPDLVRSIEGLIDDEQLDTSIARCEYLARFEAGPVMRVAAVGPFLPKLTKRVLTISLLH